MTAHAPQAAICFDPFHAMGPVTDAVEKVRRQGWQELRASASAVMARQFKGVRCVAEESGQRQAVCVWDFLRGGDWFCRGRPPSITRVLKINQLETITDDVIEAAASILVIGN